MLIYDNTAGSGAVIAVVAHPNNSTSLTLTFDTVFNTRCRLLPFLWEFLGMNMNDELLRSIAGRINVALALISIGCIEPAERTLRQVSAVLPNPEYSNLDAAMRSAELRL